MGCWNNVCGPTLAKRPWSRAVRLLVRKTAHAVNLFLSLFKLYCDPAVLLTRGGHFLTLSSKHQPPPNPQLVRSRLRIERTHHQFIQRNNPKGPIPYEATTILNTNETATMASPPSSSSSLPPDLFDKTTLISLASTLAIVLIAYLASRIALPRSSGPTIRFLFIWHLADALCHFILEGSFLYHCFFSAIPVAEARARGILADLVPTPYNFLGREDGAIYGPQSGGQNPFAQLWMVYARADRRWAGADLVSPFSCFHKDNIWQKKKKEKKDQTGTGFRDMDANRGYTKQ